MLRILLVASAIGSVATAQEPEINDIANNDTRALCIEGWGLVMDAAGPLWARHIVEGNRETMMIHAHTMRPGVLNCFITIDGKLFHLMLNLEGNGLPSMIVRYDVAEFTTVPMTQP